MNFLDYIYSFKNRIIKDNNIINNNLKDIFKDNWNKFKETYKVRNIVKHEINKFLLCGSITSGYSVYECDNCGNYKYVPFTCKSRFCPSCGVNKSINIIKFISSKTLDIPHRHITFTISDKLRIYFLKNRNLLNLLFLASEQTLISWFKQYRLTPGIIATLHTFGRDLKWNPHIHILVTEGGYTSINTFKSISHFPFTMLRKRFMGILLNLMSSHITNNEFKKIKETIVHWISTWILYLC